MTLVVPVRDESLEQLDFRSVADFLSRALGLARSVAGSPQASDERRILHDQVERLLEIPPPRERDVAVRLDAGGARVGARRRALAVDDRLLRHGLRKRDVRGAPRDEIEVEIVRHGDRADLLAVLAAGAFGEIDEGGLLHDRRLEGPVAVPADILDLACRP